MRKAKLIEREILLSGPKRFVREQLEMEDKTRIEWYFLDTPYSVAIVPITPDGNLIMVRQYRYNLKNFTLEFPSGTMKEGEEPEQSAIRELLEETGFRTSPEALTFLGKFYILPSETNRYLTAFLANPVERVSEPLLDDVIEKYFEIETIQITFEDAFAEIGQAIQGLETVSALMLARDSLHDSSHS